MPPLIEELDYRPSPIGTFALRRRRTHPDGEPIYEIRLGDNYLMSSLFTAAEIALGRLGMAAVAAPSPDVIVGGLGLGYTAVAALESAHLRRLSVIEAIPAVIAWHEEGLLPLGRTLTADRRCRLVQDDFFARFAAEPADEAAKTDAVLLDIDNSPRHLLAPANAAFYTDEGTARLTRWLRPGGVYALWSNDPPDADYEATLRRHFARVETHVIRFPNPYQEADATNTVYVAVRPS